MLLAPSQILLFAFQVATAIHGASTIVAPALLHTLLALNHTSLVIVFLHLLDIGLHVPEALLSCKRILIQVMMTTLPRSLEILLRCRPWTHPSPLPRRALGALEAL